MIQVWILIVMMISSSAFAEEFTYIKLNPQFEQYLNQSKLKSASKVSKGSNATQNTAEPVDNFSLKMRTTFLGATPVAKDFTSPFPTEGEESPLYEELRAQLEASHREIGLREVTNLDFLNRQFNLGTENFSGFSWQKPVGVVHIFADRQVTRNIFGENWVVQDTFTVDVEATTFLERANEAGVTSMSQAEIGAFAGTTFKRVYTYYSFANSYAEGLRADYSKLFLPFTKLNVNAVARMSDEEIIKREDHWTASAGGLISTPPYSGFSFSAGVLAQFAYQDMISIQNFAVTDDTTDKVQIITRGKTTASASVNMSIQAEFLKILKFTILSYDLTYESAKSKELTLAMTLPEWKQVNEDQAQAAELKSIIHGNGKVNVLEPYVIELDERQEAALQQRGALLIWGRLVKTKTEQVKVVKDNTVRVFFKSYAQNMRVVQNIFSRLFSAMVYKLLKLPVGTKNAALYNRQVDIEYEATHPQAANLEVARVESSEQFSLSITQSYEAARTDRWIDTKFKNDLIWFVDSFTTLPKDYKSIIRSEQLKGPMLIESKLLVEKAGLDYFLQTSDNAIFGQIASICGSKRINEWQKSDRRNALLGRLQAGADLCTKNIGKKFLEFRSDYVANQLKPSLVKLKAFLTKYYKQSDAIADLSALFGADNTFIHGQLKATTPTGNAFVLPFSSGQFRGLGVIDNYKRSSGPRQPASIVSE